MNGLKKWFICALSALFVCTVLSGAFAEPANTGAPAQRYWNSSKYALSLTDKETKLLFTKDGKTKVLSEDAGGMAIVGVYVCKDTAVYYARNAKGKYKWTTFDMDSGVKKEYAWNYLSPFWADSESVYTTTYGKRVYDYNVFSFDVKTGTKTKLAAVYGMPIGYIGSQLIALDYYHKELRYYEGSTLVKKLGASMKHGFIVQEKIYLILSDGVYRVDDSNLVKVIEGYTGVQAVLNGSVFLYHSGGEYPREVYFVTPSGVQKLGDAKDEAAILQLQNQAVELSKIVSE